MRHETETGEGEAAKPPEGAARPQGTLAARARALELEVEAEYVAMLPVRQQPAALRFLLTEALELLADLARAVEDGPGGRDGGAL